MLEDLLKLLDGNIFELSILCLRSPNENEGYYKQVFSDNYNLIFQNKFLEMMTWSKVMLAIHNRLRSYWGISFMVEFFYRLSAKYIEKAKTSSSRRSPRPGKDVFQMRRNTYVLC